MSMFATQLAYVKQFIYFEGDMIDIASYWGHGDNRTPVCMLVAGYWLPGDIKPPYVTTIRIRMQKSVIWGVAIQKMFICNVILNFL